MNDSQDRKFAVVPPLDPDDPVVRHALKDLIRMAAEAAYKDWKAGLIPDQIESSPEPESPPSLPCKDKASTILGFDGPKSARKNSRTKNEALATCHLKLGRPAPAMLGPRQSR